LFMAHMVRAADGARMPWAWGAKVAGLTGVALLAIGFVVGAAVGFLGLWASF